MECLYLVANLLLFRPCIIHCILFCLSLVTNNAFIKPFEKEGGFSIYEGGNEGECWSDFVSMLHLIQH